MASRTSLWMSGGGLILTVFGGLAIVGCQTEGQKAAPGVQAAQTMQGTRDQPPMAAAGAQLWAANCIRCHNIRTPASLSDRQWKIVMHHMRVRANLTADDHEAILRFLKAAN